MEATGNTSHPVGPDGASMPHLESSSRNIELAMALARDARPSYVIAAAAKVPPHVLSGLVTGRLLPSSAQADRIAGALGCERDQLFGELDQ